MKRCWVAIATLAVLGAVGATAQTFAPAPVDSIVTPRLEIEDHEEGPMFSAAVAAAAAAPPAPPAPTPPGTPSLWYDGSDIDGDGTYNSAYTDGDPVTTWVDKGSLGADATQATAAAKPTYRANGGAQLSGEPYLSFDGGDHLSTGGGAFAALAQPNTIAVVSNIGPTQSSDEYIVDGAGLSSRHVVNMRSAGWGIATSGSIISPTDDTASNNWDMAICVFNSASSFLIVNNSSYGPGNVGTQQPDGFVIGARFNFISNLSGGIAEVIIYDVGPSTSDITTYQENKYGSFPQAGTP